MLTPTPAAITIAAYAPTVPNPNTILSPLYAAVTIVTWEPSISTS